MQIPAGIPIIAPVPVSGPPPKTIDSRSREAVRTLGRSNNEALTQTETICALECPHADEDELLRAERRGQKGGSMTKAVQW